MCSDYGLKCHRCKYNITKRSFFEPIVPDITPICGCDSTPPPFCTMVYANSDFCGMVMTLSLSYNPVESKYDKNKKECNISYKTTNKS